MKNLDPLTRFGLFGAQVPRYTGYPAAPIFSKDGDHRFPIDIFGDLAKNLEPIHVQVSAAFDDFVVATSSGLENLPQGRPLTRIIAQHYDSYIDTPAIYSKAS